MADGIELAFNGLTALLPTPSPAQHKTVIHVHCMLLKASKAAGA
jgi:hypothetical protein